MQDSDRGRLLTGHQELPELVGEGAPRILQTSQGRRLTVVRVVRSGGSPIPHSWAPSVPGPVRAPPPTLRMPGVPASIHGGHCPRRTEGLVAGQELQAFPGSPDPREADYGAGGEWPVSERSFIWIYSRSPALTSPPELCLRQLGLGIRFSQECELQP